MACRLIGAKPLSAPMLIYRLSDPLEQISMKFKSKLEIFYSIYTFENVVCEMGVILSRPQCVNVTSYIYQIISGYI